ncbi:MAG TPA: hypothetical protein VI407_00890 [Erythrobacter sp.]
MIRKGLAGVLAALACAAAPAAAQLTSPVPAVRVAPPPPSSSPAPTFIQLSDLALFARFCGGTTVSEGIPQLRPGTRIGFADDPDGPASLVLCIDQYKAALAIPVTSTDDALVIMAFKPFAPLWPAAEARWGSDLERLREEVRRTPLETALAAYPYAAQMDPATAEVFAASRTASAAGDHDRARALVEAELVRLGAIEAAGRANGRKKRDVEYGFEISLLIGRIANLEAYAKGPSAGADLLARLLEQYPLDEDYRANPVTNLGALLAEAGRSAEALAVIAPFAEGIDPDRIQPERYQIPGSIREFSWIAACAQNGVAGASAADPYIRVVNSFRRGPVDPYVGWTRSNAAIKLRMYKCLGDMEGYAAAWRSEQPGPLSVLWLEFQEHGRSMVGHRRLDAPLRAALAAEFARDYRELPESYRPALRAWWPERAGEE